MSREDRVEFFTAEICRCKTCGAEYPAYASIEPESCCHLQPLERTDVWAWWYWFCLPGCLPDSDPSGPFDSELEAQEDCWGDDEDEEEVG